MIITDKEFEITARQLETLKRARESFDIEAASVRLNSDTFAKAELAVLDGEVQRLESEISEYKELQSGSFQWRMPTSFEELPKTLIVARIAKRLTHDELAQGIGISAQQLYRIETEWYEGADRSLLVKIAHQLGIETKNLASASEQPHKPKPLGADELDWSRFPVMEMKKRGWFEGINKDKRISVVEKASLAKYYVTSIVDHPALAMHRKSVRANSIIDDYALLAWECRVLSVAKRLKTGAIYDRDRLDKEWVANLIRESRFPDGPLRAREYLSQAGIILVIEPHLRKTYLDGAALLYEGAPVVAMTLRHDRIDNFWFVLLHEIGHIILHLQHGVLEEIFDDLEADADKLEREADEFASEALIPEVVWRKSMAKFTQSEDAIRALAGQLHISPSIIAGRIRLEMNNYKILADLVGPKEVRTLFLNSKL